MDSKIQFNAHEGRPISKWGHYFPVYDMFFRAFVGRPTQILEIGVWKGGCVLSQDTSFSESWLRKPGYEECGPSAIWRHISMQN